MESLLSAKELAQLLHVSRDWVTTQANDHVLPGYKVGGAWRFDAAEVSAWLGRQGNAPTRRPDVQRGVLPVRERATPPSPSVKLDTAIPAAEVCGILRVPLPTLKQWIREGILPGLIVKGGDCLIDLDGWEQWKLILGYPDGHVFTLPPGQMRSTSTRNAIESAMLRKRSGPWALTPTSARHRGAPIPTWAEVFPSGRI